MQPNKTFIIRLKGGDEVFVAHSGKTSWRSTGAAKNAFNISLFSSTLDKYHLRQTVWPLCRYKRPDMRFDNQNVWEIVELKLESETKLDQAVQLLTSCLGRLDSYVLENEVKEFLGGFKN